MKRSHPQHMRRKLQPSGIRTWLITYRRRLTHLIRWRMPLRILAAIANMTSHDQILLATRNVFGANSQNNTLHLFKAISPKSTLGSLAPIADFLQIPCVTAKSNGDGFTSDCIHRKYVKYLQCNVNITYIRLDRFIGPPRLRCAWDRLVVVIFHVLPNEKSHRPMR
jgi:hypothetical protein